MKKERASYHHGNLAESLLDAVDETATRFGLEAVTLRGCAKLVGVSPSSAFRHYTDKRALLTAFATRALRQLADAMSLARERAVRTGDDPFAAVGLAYVRFALEKPAFFRAMWREETIYVADANYVTATNALGMHLKGGFASTLEDDDPTDFSSAELLAWSSVHGLAALFVDGPIGAGRTLEGKLDMARAMIATMAPALSTSPSGTSPISPPDLGRA